MLLVYFLNARHNRKKHYVFYMLCNLDSPSGPGMPLCKEQRNVYHMIKIKNKNS